MGEPDAIGIAVKRRLMSAERPYNTALSELRRFIERRLSSPLEDIYAAGQPAGQVGQEIYGVGAAAVFATRAFHPVKGAPFLPCHAISVRRLVEGRADPDRFTRKGPSVGKRGGGRAGETGAPRSAT